MPQYIARRTSVGKKIGNCIYIHKSAINHLPDNARKLVSEKLYVLDVIDFDYCIIKVDVSKKQVSFIESPDWDTSNEPIVGDSILIKNGTIRHTKAKKQIYHHKWMFVDDSYTGFNIELSKQRSEKWMNNIEILNLKKNPDIKFSSKIGYKSYWETICSMTGIDI